jgi:hypothetical protein
MLVYLRLSTSEHSSIPTSSRQFAHVRRRQAEPKKRHSPSTTPSPLRKSWAPPLRAHHSERCLGLPATDLASDGVGPSSRILLSGGWEEGQAAEERRLKHCMSWTRTSSPGLLLFRKVLTDALAELAVEINPRRPVLRTFEANTCKVLNISDSSPGLV